MAQDDLRTAIEGTCQVCERAIRVRGEPLAMVHHGYERPGDGQIHGDCYAVGREPYEVSCAATREYRALVEERLGYQEERLRRLHDRVVRTITDVQSLWSQPKIVEYVVGVTEPYLWERVYESAVRETSWRISCEKREVERLTRMIDDWKPRSLHEIMEARQAKVKAERDQRAAERAAARAVKLEKAKALAAKRAALEEARAKVRKEFAEAIVALAARQPTAGARTTEVRQLAQRLTLKKYSWLNWRDLGCDDALIHLGLARRERGPGWDFVSYTYTY